MPDGIEIMEIVKISAIKANSKNPRVIKDEKFKKLVQSIREFPDMLNKRPLICFTDVDGKYVVLGGNMRLKAAQEIGLKEMPIILADDWTQEQKDEFLIKDNVGFGEWDWDILANEWDTDKLTDWGLSSFGFEDNLSNNQDYGNLGQLSLLDNYLNSEIKRMFLVYDNETFVNVVKWFEQKQNEFNCEDNSQVILKIIENEKF
jgi:hypothetical protein